MRRLAEGVYRLESGGFVNSFLIAGERDLTLVDAGPARRLAALLAELKDNGFSLGDVGRVVVTHAHPDHAGGVPGLLELRPIKVFAHPLEASVLTGVSAAPRPSGLGGRLLYAAAGALLGRRTVESVIPADTGTPVRGLPQWQVVHSPGHTPGSISLYEPARQILLCGDALRTRPGRVEFLPDGVHHAPAAARATVASLGRMDVDILGCGHGPEVRGGAFRHIEALVRP